MCVEGRNRKMYSSMIERSLSAPPSVCICVCVSSSSVLPCLTAFLEREAREKQLIDVPLHTFTLLIILFYKGSSKF